MLFPLIVLHVMTMWTITSSENEESVVDKEDNESVYGEGDS